MLALVSADVTDPVTEAFAEQLGWETCRVSSVADALHAMTAEEKEAVAAVVVEADPINAETIEQLPALELVACLRGTPVNVDIIAASQRHVPVVYTPGRNATSVADFTLGLLLATLRNLAITHHRVVDRDLTEDGTGLRRSGDDVIWRPSDPLELAPYHQYMGPELSGLVIAVIGYGEVGRAVAGRLGGLVRHVLVVDPAVDPTKIVMDGFSPSSLDDALVSADVVTLHAKSPTVIVGARELALMKSGSYLINTARASVLDYDALADALHTGHLRGAALDVFPVEPLPSSSPLLDVPTLTLTPHIAGASESVTARHSEILLQVLPRIYDPDSSWSELPVANAEVRSSWKPATFLGAVEP